MGDDRQLPPTNFGAARDDENAVRKRGDASHRLAVLVDTDAHYAVPGDERHRIKPNLLRAFGWRIETVLAKDWRESPDEVLERIRRGVEAS